MAQILLPYFGVYGHTRRVAECMSAELLRLGHVPAVRALAEGEVDPAPYDAVLIGASIRHGKHNPAVLTFIRRHQALLESRPSGFFSVSLVARKPAKNTPETNPYVKAFVAASPWKPRLVGVFGGNLDYQRYGFMDRHIIRFIMTLTGGPTDLRTNVEYTDWDKVRGFAAAFARMVDGDPG